VACLIYQGTLIDQNDRRHLDDSRVQLYLPRRLRKAGMVGIYLALLSLRLVLLYVKLALLTKRCWYELSIS
jgi:hypothetical protein